MFKPADSNIRSLYDKEWTGDILLIRLKCLDNLTQSLGSMNSKLLIHNLEFSRTGKRLSHDVPLLAMPRLAGMLDMDCLNVSHCLSFVLQGCQVAGKSGLTLTISTNPPLICQRCLQPMTLPMQMHFAYVLSDAEPVDLDEEIDWLEISDAMDLYALIEDEVMMALPLAPKHERACQSGPMTSGEKSNPFAVLQGRFSK